MIHRGRWLVKPWFVVFADFTPRPSRGIILAGGTAMYRILIVEDDPVITETLCAYMGRWGMEARGVEDFQNVLREFAAFDPQLVLMDISLPFFDGYHWCAEIRKISTAPILFISSAGDNLNILRALDAGRGRLRFQAL